MNKEIKKCTECGVNDFCIKIYDEILCNNCFIEKYPDEYYELCEG